jgi:hypothetical protein
MGILSPRLLGLLIQSGCVLFLICFRRDGTQCWYHSDWYCRIKAAPLTDLAFSPSEPDLAVVLTSRMNQASANGSTKWKGHDR